MQLAKFVFTLSMAVSTALAAAAFIVPSVEARAVGGTSGDLNSGGDAKGDISMQAGETDLIRVALVAGSAVDVTFTAGFGANLALTDPAGAPIEIGYTGAKTFRLRGYVPPATGAFQFAVSSADGSQGSYSLSVKPKWSKSMSVSGSGQQTFEFAMPGNGSVSAVVSREKGAAGQPLIVGLVAPDGSNLSGTIDPVKNTVKLPATPTTTNGLYRLTISSTDGSSAWKGVVKRTLPKVATTHLKLANGIDAISYSADGIDEIFKRRCAECHAWSNGFAGVRAYATVSLGKIKSGSMPPDGRLPADQIKLIQAWMGTGRQK